MLKAVDSDGIHVHSFDLVERPEENLLCPECGGQVIFKKGRIKISHFAHKPDSNCSYGTGESEAHMLMKKNFYEMMIRKYPSLNIEIEDGNFRGRRADISIRGKSKNVVVEFQASKISTEEIMQRTKDYNSQGFHVLWIFHISRIRHERFFEKGERRMAEELRSLERQGVLYIMSDGSEIRKVKFTGGRSTKTMRKCAWEDPSELKFKFELIELSRGQHFHLVALDYPTLSYPKYEEFIKLRRKKESEHDYSYLLR